MYLMEQAHLEVTGCYVTPASCLEPRQTTEEHHRPQMGASGSLMGSVAWPVARVLYQGAECLHDVCVRTGVSSDLFSSSVAWSVA